MIKEYATKGVCLQIFLGFIRNIPITS